MLGAASSKSGRTPPRKKHDGTSEQRETLTRIDYDQLHRPTVTTSGIRLTSPGSTAGQDKSHASVVRVAYDSADNVVEATDANGLHSFFSYDHLGRKTLTQRGGAERITITLPLDRSKHDAEISLHGYDVFNNLTIEDAPSGHTEHRYDLLGRRMSSLSGLHQSTGFKFDIVGNTVSVTHGVKPSWHLYKNEHTEAGPNFATGDWLYKSVHHEYDVLGRLLKTVETDGSWSRTWHDALGRVTRRTERFAPGGSGPQTIGANYYTYDKLNRLLVDSMNRSAWTDDPNANSTPAAPAYSEYHIQYDAADNLIVASRSIGDGVNAPVAGLFQQTMTYDSLDRLTQDTTPFGLTLNYRYDAAGHTVRTTDSQGGLLWSDYDPAGRLATRRLTVANLGGEQVQFEYEPAPAGAVGKRSRMAAAVTVALDSAGQSTGVGARLAHTYDSTGHLDFRTLFPVPARTTQPNFLESFGYVFYKHTGLLQTEHRNSETANPKFVHSTTYTYDSYGQTKSVDRTGWQDADRERHRTQYDGAGMPIYGHVDMTTQANKDLAEASINNGRAASYYEPYSRFHFWKQLYDSNGSVTTQTQTWINPHEHVGQPLQKFAYRYDARMQLVEAREISYVNGQPPSSEVLVQTLNYDFDFAGRLVQRTVSNSSFQMQSQTRFINVGETLYAELDGVTGLILNRNLRDDSGLHLGRLETRDTGFHRDVYATDRLGSVAALYRIDGSALVRMMAVEYEGLNPVAYTGSLTDPVLLGQTDNEPFSHSGRWTDAQTLLQWDGSRWLDPWGKRFLTEGGRTTASSSTYTYASNSFANPEPKRTADTRFQAEVRKLIHEREERDQDARRRWESAYLGWALDMWEPIAEMGETASDMVRGGRFGLGLYPSEYEVPQYRGKDRIAWLQAQAFGDEHGRMGPEAGEAYLSNSRIETGKAMLTPWKPLVQGWNAGMDSGDWRQFRGALGGTLPMLVGLRGAVRAGGPMSVRLGQWAKAGGALAKEVVLSHTLPMGTRSLVSGTGWAIGKGLKPWEASYGKWAHGRHDAGQLGGTAAIKAGEWLRWKVCFAAGTPLRTPEGWKWIELFREGDLVLSRDENNPNGLVVAKVVEEVFVREGLIWHLHIGGQVIRTTAEHPFFVDGRGWLACHELKVGDRLLDEDGRWIAVDDVLDTGEWETVYNLRVADFHTYFVGSPEWGFSVWAHNSDCPINRYTRQMGDKARQAELEAGQLQREARLQRGKAVDKAEAQALYQEQLLDSPATLLVNKPSRLVDNSLSPMQQSHRLLHNRIKEARIQEAARSGAAKYAPGTVAVRDSGLQSRYRQEVIDRYRRIYKKEPPQLRLRDADHPKEMVLGFPADQSLKLLESHINRSYGSSIGSSASKLPPGQAIGRIIIRPGE